MSAVKHVNDAAFENEVLDAAGAVVVDFYADWCPPCRRLAPVLESLATRYQGKVKFVKVNTDADPAWASQLGIKSLPTLLFIRDGKLVDHHLGFAPEGYLDGLVKAVSDSPAA